MAKCRECDCVLGAESYRGRPRVFCSSVCKMDWHNRRRVRGAALYDLYMAHRYERQLAKTEALSPLHRMSVLAMQFHDEDAALRGGRPTWNYREVCERMDDGKLGFEGV